MDYVKLGSTNLNVSVAGLGCGGNSKLGLWRGKNKAHAVRLVRRALELGVNFIDTAHSYGTEEAVGEGIKGVPRDDVVIGTKYHPAWDGKIHSVKTVIAGLNESLQRLDLDYVDIFHLHGVHPKYYSYVMEDVVPALMKEQDKGKFRHLGITELATVDPGHEVLIRAADEGYFDVFMMAFHLMHQTARRALFPLTQDRGIGTLIMFAVRTLFSEPGRLKRDVEDLVAAGQLPETLTGASDPLDFLLHPHGADSVIDACYRYARHTDGADVVLFGTSSLEHLESNLASIAKPALPEADVAKIEELFQHLEGVGLDLPDPSKRI